MKPLRSALAQCRQTADLAENERTIHRCLEQAATATAQIVCFPEAQTVGYRVDISTPDAHVPAGRLEAVHAGVAQRCRELGVACILGTETPRDADQGHGLPYNSALVIRADGAVLGRHHKARLTPLDAIAYSPGEGFETYEICGVRIGVVICFEGFRFPETTRECVRQGAQVIFHPQNNTTRPNDWKIPIHHAMLVTRAAENTVWVASCNACLIPHQNCETRVIAPDGRIHARAEMEREELLVTDLDVDQATRAMFLYDPAGSMPLLFGDTVRPEEVRRPA